MKDYHILVEQLVVPHRIKQQEHGLGRFHKQHQIHYTIVVNIILVW